MLTRMPSGATLQSKGLRKHRERRFGRTIGARAFVGDLSRHRRRETCRPAALLQVRIAILRKQPGPAKVDVEHPVPFGERQIADFSWACHAGIGNKRVETPKRRHRRIDKFCRDIGVADITCQGNGLAAHFPHRMGNLFLRVRGLTTANGDLRAFTP